MMKGYRGTALADRAGCLAAVIGTPVVFFILFANFMPDFIMPKGSIILEVFLPTLIAGGGLFFFVRTAVRLIKR